MRAGWLFALAGGLTLCIGGAEKAAADPAIYSTTDIEVTRSGVTIVRPYRFWSPRYYGSDFARAGCCATYGWGPVPYGPYGGPYPYGPYAAPFAYGPAGIVVVPPPVIYFYPFRPPSAAIYHVPPRNRPAVRKPPGDQPTGALPPARKPPAASPPPPSAAPPAASSPPPVLSPPAPPPPAPPRKDPPKDEPPVDL